MIAGLMVIALSPLIPYGRLVPAVGFLLIFSFAKPVYYFLDAGTALHVGIAGAVPRIMTTGLVLLFASAWFALRRPQSEVNGVLFVPFLGYLVLALAIVWETNRLTLAGSLALTMAVLGWYCGSKTLRYMAENSEHSIAVVSAALAFMAIQSVIGILQTAGVDLFVPVIVDDDTVAGRANGTFDHPASLGKVVLLVCIIVLPFVVSAAKRISSLAVLTLLLASVPLALSAGRANLLAYAVLLGSWFLLSLSRKLIRVRVGPSILVVVPVLAFIGWIAWTRVVARNETDPRGGGRERFYNVAMQHLGDVWTFGVGPNSYVEYFGRFDRLTAVGWPVHNAPLLLVTEIGAVGLLLLCIPLIHSCFLAATRVRRRDISGDSAAVWFCAVVALFPVMTTGWGLLNESIFPALMHTFGFLYQAMRDSDIAATMSKQAVLAETSNRMPG